MFLSKPYVEDAEAEIAELAAELEKTLPPNPEDRFPLRTLKAIGRFMFEELGFEGNQEEFYDPRNSCLDEVLARRKGIPITLSLVYMELARRVGLPMVRRGLSSKKQQDERERVARGLQE
jgi:regulator of sirC expression with transglutaminase-like and TPR domain